jgi:hypothetical protein
MWILPVMCLGACDPAAKQGAPSAPPFATPAASPVTPQASTPTASAADAGLAIAIARESVDRAARQQTLHVQKLLRDEAQAQREAQAAARRGDGNERCLSGQRMRRVANGWVQAGAC